MLNARVEAVNDATSESAGDLKSSSSSLFLFQDTLLSARLKAFAKHCDVKSLSFTPLLLLIKCANTA